VETSLEIFWNQVLEQLQLQLSRPTFETWIKPATIEQLEADRLVICTPNPFARNWLQKYYLKTISDVVQGLLGYTVEIQIIVKAGEAGAAETNQWPLPNESPTEAPAPMEAEPVAVSEALTGTITGVSRTGMPASQPVAQTSVTSVRLKQTELNAKYVFSRFVVGANNRMAHAASLAVAESPGKEFNPLFLCGGVGAGQNPSDAGNWPLSARD
jgi:chromosomal replication initiator protein